MVERSAIPGYGAIFNAGLLHHDGRYHLFARAIREGYRRNDGQGPRFLNYLSDIVVLESDDGERYDFGYVLTRSGTDLVHCYEDPRVQWVTSDGIDHLVMTYTNLPDPSSGLPCRIGAHRLLYDGSRFSLDEESGTLLGPEAIANKDAVLFNLDDGRVAMIHRIHPNMQLAVFDSLDHLWGADAGYWARYCAELESHTIIRPSLGAMGVGAGAPPVVTDAGRLLFFHERDHRGVYLMKLALLNATTGRVVAMLDRPLLEPELEWEITGDVDHVVFVQGAHRRDDGSIYLTYGAADAHVGAAITDESSLLEMLHSKSA